MPFLTVFIRFSCETILIILNYTFFRPIFFKIKKGKTVFSDSIIYFRFPFWTFACSLVY
jgi:hypothetical protein